MFVNKAPIKSYLSVGKSQLQSLIDGLHKLGYQTIGPRIVDGAIVYGELNAISDLPVGYVDWQDGGKYRLEPSDEAGHFDYVVGPDSLKKFLFPARETLLQSIRVDGTWNMATPDPAPHPLAVFGVRSCDLHALAIQDKVFLGGPYVDPGYQSRRNALFVVAVNCRRAAATCFCHSMKTGPAVEGGFDLALTELADRFVVQVGSTRGAEVMTNIEWTACTLQDIDDARSISKTLRDQMRTRAHNAETQRESELPRERHLDTTDIHDLLLDNLEHPRWSQVANRCLACANCTMVCPTCFCSSVSEVSDLSGDNVRRERAWDSCFTAEHSYMNTGTVRKTTASRYRQWLTHKLATWTDQFGTSGCVGCGRCITWCPVGIDLTEEVAAIRGDES